MWTHVGEHCVWIDPLIDSAEMLFVVPSVVVLCDIPSGSLDLRSSLILRMCNSTLRGCQTLLRNWVVIKVAFGYVMKHVVGCERSRRNLPLLITGEISLGPSR